MALINPNAPIKMLPMRRGEVYVTISTDPTIAEQKLGFKTAVDLEEGLRAEHRLLPACRIVTPPLGRAAVPKLLPTISKKPHHRQKTAPSSPGAVYASFMLPACSNTSKNECVCRSR